MRILFNTGVLFILSNIFACQSVYSKNYVYPSLYIASIIADTNLINDKDELFIDVIEYSKPELIVTENRFPKFPNYWTLESLSTLKNLSIWNGILKISEDKILYIIFKDQDFWSYDDIIGYIKLNLSFDGTVIRNEWEIINAKRTLANISTNNSEHLQKVRMLSDKAIYNINIGITLTKRLPQKKDTKSTTNLPLYFPKPYMGIYIQ